MPREVPQYVSQLQMGSMPQVQYSNAQADALGQVSDMAYKRATDIHEKDLEIAAIRADTDIKTTLQRQYEEFGNDPGQLKAAQEAYRKTWVAGLPSELRAKGEAQWDAYAQPYLSKSTEIYKDNQDSALKLSYIEGFPHDLKTGSVAVDGMDSSVPEDQVASYRSLGAARIKLDAMRQAKRHDGRLMFSPEEILSYENKITSAANARAEANRKGVFDKKMREDPKEFLLNIDKMSFKNDKEKAKYQDDAMAMIEKNQKTSDLMTVLQQEKSHASLVDLVDQGSPDAYAAIEEARNEGVSPIFLDKLSDRMNKIRPVSVEQKDSIYANIADRVEPIGITVTSDGGVDIEGDVTLDDLLQLNRDIVMAQAQGVPGLGRFRNKVGAAIREKSRGETGVDDPGFGWWFGPLDPAEKYDQGYQIIQDYLVKQGKEEDSSTKTRLLKEYYNSLAKLPDSVREDEGAMREYIASKARETVTLDLARSNGGNIPYHHIKTLLAHPESAADFDKHYGPGAAKRILGK